MRSWCGCSYVNVRVLFGRANEDSRLGKSVSGVLEEVKGATRDQGLWVRRDAGR